MVVVLSLATFMEVLDTTIVNVALRHIAGSLAAGIDQASWVVTSYLVANAVVMPISAWLASVLGRKRFYLLCVLLFTASSAACGMAWNLESLLFFRVLQGLAGGGLVPSEQSMIADMFPPTRRAKAFALYGVAVVVAPVLGPVVGGWITDSWSWRWIFLINLPIGLVSLVLTHLLVHEPPAADVERLALLDRGIRFDWLGCLLVVIGFGCLEVVLDEGLRKDWFESGYIVRFAIMAGISLGALILWEWNHDDPLVDVRILGDRHFGSCCLVMFGIGWLLVASTQVLPQLMQSRFAYDATTAALTLLPGGIATLLLMPVGGWLVRLAHPALAIVFGMACVAASMVLMTRVSAETSFEYVAWVRAIFGVGLPFLFVTINSVSYDGLPPARTDQASSLVSIARNLGGSCGVAISTTLLARGVQVHQSQLVETTVPTDLGYSTSLDKVAAYFQTAGFTEAEALERAVTWIGRTVSVQAELLSYIDLFWWLATVAVVAACLGMFLRRPKSGAHDPKSAA